MKTRILALLLVLSMLVCFCSCDLLWGDVAEEGDVTVVVEAEDGSYMVYKTYLEQISNKNEGAKGVVEHLNSREESPLYLVMTDSTLTPARLLVALDRRPDIAHRSTLAKLRAERVVQSIERILVSCHRGKRLVAHLSAVQYIGDRVR